MQTFDLCPLGYEHSLGSKQVRLEALVALHFLVMSFALVASVMEGGAYLCGGGIRKKEASEEEDMVVESVLVVT